MILGILIGLYVAGYIAFIIAIACTCGFRQIAWWGWLMTPFYLPIAISVVLEDRYSAVGRWWHKKKKEKQ